MTPSKEAVELVDRIVIDWLSEVDHDNPTTMGGAAARAALLAHIAALEADALRWRKVAPLIEGMREAVGGVVTPWIESKERRCIDTGALDLRGYVCDGMSIGPVEDADDPDDRWPQTARAIVAAINGVRALLAALGVAP